MSEILTGDMCTSWDGIKLSHYVIRFSVVVLFARTQLLFTICNVTTAVDSLIDRNPYRKTQQDATVYQNFIIPYFK
jgi:hypothetical protein